MTSSGERRRPRPGDPHGWTSLQNYLNVHHRRLDNLRGDFIVADNLRYDFPSPWLFEIRGRIFCQHGLFLDVDKTLEINRRQQVRTIKYSYHAGVEGEQDRPIFRYDNAHRYVREGHPDEHHRHRFDHATWREIDPPDWVGRERWPHLSDAIEELRVWWESTGIQLDLSEP